MIKYFSVDCFRPEWHRRERFLFLKTLKDTKTRHRPPLRISLILLEDKPCLITKVSNSTETAVGREERMIGLGFLFLSYVPCDFMIA